jgi:hypothetical protein
MLVRRLNESLIISDSRTRVLTRRLLGIVDSEEKLRLNVWLVGAAPMTGIGVGLGDINWTALSWRWDTRLALTIEMGSLTSHLDYFALLPKTFHDAVSVAHMLGVKYLCIAALCIVHDDPQDLCTELAIMGNIYADSYCNLAAHSARD